MKKQHKKQLKHINNMKDLRQFFNFHKQNTFTEIINSLNLYLEKRNNLFLRGRIAQTDIINDKIWREIIPTQIENAEYIKEEKTIAEEADQMCMLIGKIFGRLNEIKQRKTLGLENFAVKNLIYERFKY